MRGRQAPCTFSPCHGIDSARIPLCDFPGGARWPPSCSRHRQHAIPCTNVPGAAFGRAYRAACAVSMAACGIPSGDRRGHLFFGRCTRIPVKALSAVCLRPVAGIFLECLEERLHWVGMSALWAKPRRAGVLVRTGALMLCLQGRWRAVDDGITQHALVVCHG